MESAAAKPAGAAPNLDPAKANGPDQHSKTGVREAAMTGRDHPKIHYGWLKEIFTCALRGH